MRSSKTLSAMANLKDASVLAMPSSTDFNSCNNGVCLSKSVMVATLQGGVHPHDEMYHTVYSREIVTEYCRDVQQQAHCTACSVWLCFV